MARLVLRLTPLAKFAASAAALGVLGAVYGRLQNAPTIGGIGSVVFFGGVIVYYFERYRMIKSAREARRAEVARKIDEES